MNRGLVVVANTDRHRALLETAGEFASGSDAELVLLSTLTETEYEDDRNALKSLEEIEGATYGIDATEERLERAAQKIVNDTIVDMDVDYQIAPRVIGDGSLADEILQVAEELACDHIFIVGQKRSPTGKALFGNVAQAVILGFDGQVTVDLE
ncbi:UspA domain-containing protein [Halovivax asiaticus JCM 14624]|uniref:UspA domain-containing protein n=1 Tax=Halovivax asiaticus JCM 14624 TaxID=1227490 RepID=M0BR69_9EURY|nr:universal stress protein [Halovivax asiaticus]ELZ12184.1 UspA domain-containing protein [Halovivax asiaticus JCM 14624]